ncbi:MAG: alkaline phosphatase family protein [Clostridia bacterium]
MRRLWTGLVMLAALVAVLFIYVGIVLHPSPRAVPAAQALPPPFSHVFVIVMENQSAAALMTNPGARYIQGLASRYAYDSAYYGVTHPSLPNYVALIAGTTYGTHSDSPSQRFSGPTLANQLDRAGISWQGVMQSLPYAGFDGAWSPGRSEAPPTLYAEKHDPFLLFSDLRRRDRNHIVPLTTLARELTSGRVPRFVFLTPNLCDDMHGQASGPDAACPGSNRELLVRDGNDARGIGGDGQAILA